MNEQFEDHDAELEAGLRAFNRAGNCSRSQHRPGPVARAIVGMISLAAGCASALFAVLFFIAPRPAIVWQQIVAALMTECFIVTSLFLWLAGFGFMGIGGQRLLNILDRFTKKAAFAVFAVILIVFFMTYNAMMQ